MAPPPDRDLPAAEDFRCAGCRGSGSTISTARWNLEAFGQIALQPRALRDVSRRRLGTRFLGGSLDLPLMLARVGSLGMFRLGAKRDAILTAHRFGIPVCLSGFAKTAPEDMLGPPRPEDAWQLYLLKDRGRTQAIIDRIAAAGFGALFVTVDTGALGRRERDTRNGLRRITCPNAGMLGDFARHPRWLPDLARIWPPQMGIARGWPAAGRHHLDEPAFLAGQIAPSFNRCELEWLRTGWNGRLVVKGMNSPMFRGRLLR